MKYLLLLAVTLCAFAIICGQGGPGGPPGGHRGGHGKMRDLCAGNITDAALQRMEKHFKVMACVETEAAKSATFQTWKDCIAQANPGDTGPPKTIAEAKAKCSTSLQRPNFEAMRSCGRPMTSEEHQAARAICRPQKS